MTQNDSDESKTQKPKTPLTPFGGWNTPQDGGPTPMVSQPDGSQTPPQSPDDVYKGERKKVDFSKIRSFSATFGVVNSSIDKLDEALKEAEEEEALPAPASESPAEVALPKLQENDPFAFNPDELPPESTPRKLAALKGDMLKAALENNNQLATGFTFASASIVGTASIVEVAVSEPAESFDNPFDLSPEKEEEGVSSSWNFSTDASSVPPAPQNDDAVDIEEEISKPAPEEDMLFNPFKIALKDPRSTPAISNDTVEDASLEKEDTPTTPDDNDPFAIPTSLRKQPKAPAEPLAFAKDDTPAEETPASKAPADIFASVADVSDTDSVAEAESKEDKPAASDDSNPFAIPDSLSTQSESAPAEPLAFAEDDAPAEETLSGKAPADIFASVIDNEEQQPSLAEAEPKEEKPAASDDNNPFAIPDSLSTQPEHASAEPLAFAADDTPTEEAPARKAPADIFAPVTEPASSVSDTDNKEQEPSVAKATEPKAEDERETPLLAEEAPETKNAPEALFNPFAALSSTEEPKETSLSPEPSSEATDMPIAIQQNNNEEDAIPQPLFESGEEIGQDRLLVNSDDEQGMVLNPLTSPASDPFSISDFTEEANAPAAEHTPAFGQKSSTPVFAEEKPAEPQPPATEEAPASSHFASPSITPIAYEPSAYEEDEAEGLTTDSPLSAQEQEEDTFPAPASHSEAEVATILALHAQWLESQGKQGRRANFRNASLEHYDFSQQNLSEASFRGANLNGASFTGSSLHGADLSEASLVGVNFTGADLSNIMAMRADIRHSALENAYLVHADLTGASLSGANLRHLDMSGVTLMEADLHHADLQGSFLREANLRAANFAHTNLHQVDLSGANCRDVIFHHARITFANVENANFKAARLEEVDFKGTDITRAEELDPEYTQETMQAGMEQLNEEWGKLEQKSSELEETRNLLESERNRLNAEKQQLMDELQATQREKQALEEFIVHVDEAFKRHKKSIKKLKVFTVLWGLITLLVGAGIFLLINALELKTLDWMELSVVFGCSVFILGLFISTTRRCLAITSNFRKLRELMQQRVNSSH